MSASHPLFPVTLNADWRSPSIGELNDLITEWLLDPTSLTLRLKSHCKHFEVKVLGQQIQKCSEAESHGEILKGDDVLVREVLLYCDGTPHVFARSLLPLSSLTGEEKKLAELGSQSLGQVLFNHPNIQRKDIQIAQFDQSTSVAHLSHYLFEDILNKTNIYADSLWGRRSIFILNNKPLMVAEVFLPPALAYKS